VKLADTAAIALLTGRKPSTIRWWAKRGHLTRYGTPARAMYDVEEAEREAAKRPQHQSRQHP
jgi:hypothetical protein